MSTNDQHTHTDTQTHTHTHSRGVLLLLNYLCRARSFSPSFYPSLSFALSLPLSLAKWYLAENGHACRRVTRRWHHYVPRHVNLKVRSTSSALCCLLSLARVAPSPALCCISSLARVALYVHKKALLRKQPQYTTDHQLLHN